MCVWEKWLKAGILAFTDSLLSIMKSFNSYIWLYVCTFCYVSFLVLFPSRIIWFWATKLKPKQLPVPSCDLQIVTFCFINVFFFYMVENLSHICFCFVISDLNLLNMNLYKHYFWNSCRDMVLLSRPSHNSCRDSSSTWSPHEADANKLWNIILQQWSQIDVNAVAKFWSESIPSLPFT